jgi:hypothetical protein
MNQIEKNKLCENELLFRRVYKKCLRHWFEDLIHEYNSHSEIIYGDNDSLLNKLEMFRRSIKKVSIKNGKTFGDLKNMFSKHEDNFYIYRQQNDCFEMTWSDLLEPDNNIDKQPLTP